MVRVPKNSSAFRELSVRGCRREVDGLLASWEGGDGSVVVAHEIEVCVRIVGLNPVVEGGEGGVEGIDDVGVVGSDELFCGKVWICGVSLERILEMGHAG